MARDIVPTQSDSRLSHSFGNDPPGEGSARLRLLDLPVGLVEEVRQRGGRWDRSQEAFSPEFQVCLPYHGVFVWHVGGEDVVGDANQVVVVTGGESYRLSTPLTNGYAELIITPDQDVLSEILQIDRNRLSVHRLFRQRSWRASPRLQAVRARFLHWARAADADGLAAEEVVVELLRATLLDGSSRADTRAPSSLVVRRAKEYLEARLSNRVSLTDVGRAVGASPAYLTDVFRRTEGIPLHQYLTRLRLARALVELPDADDLASLALDLGFSSHSHFTAAFRRAFGITPSKFRDDTRRAIRPAGPSHERSSLLTSTDVVVSVTESM